MDKKIAGKCSMECKQNNSKGVYSEKYNQTPEKLQDREISDTLG
jgi:hypothetical protein